MERREPIDKSTNRVAIVYRPISELKLDPRNPRLHSPRQIRQIAHSIEVFGFNVPVLVDRDLKVIAGHGRILACQQLGWREVPTIGLDHLSEAQARAFMLADNRLSENSEWGERLLAEQLKELAELDLDFSLEATGFDMGEIDLRIEGLNDEQGDDDVADKIPVVPPGPPVSRPGDLWLLGPHRLYCGNALEAASYLQLMNGQKATMVFTDPPYNVAIENNVSGFGSNQHRNFQMASGEMGADEFTAFLTIACTQASRHTVSGSVHYYCMDRKHIIELHDAGRAARLELLNICIWAKQSAGMGTLYRSQYELIFVFRNGRARHRNNVQLGRFGRDRSNLWSYPGAAGLRASEEGNLIASHPTPKPVAMVADAIMDVSARNDIVLDPFLGSGTTIIAAQRTGRRCYGLEIDPRYVDVIVRRWQAFTRDRVVHAAHARSFDDVALERGNCNGR